MKLLLFIDSLGAGGAQRQLVGLANMLHEEGHEVRVVVYHDVMFYRKDLLPGIDVELLQAGKLTRVFALSKVVGREHPDWMIAYLESPSIIACLAKLRYRSMKLMVSERNTTQINNWRERLRFTLFRLADSVVPNSQSQAAFIASHYPALKKKTTAIPNFVDLSHFSYFAHTRHEVQEVLVAASIWASKNTLGFIRALGILKERGLRLHVRWFGISHENEAYLQQCYREIDKHGVGDMIELCEKDRNILDRYHEADWMVLPSYYEGTPNVICEAISTGLPVVCSDVCDNGFYVRSGENGWLFDPKDAKSIADALEIMIRISDEQYAAFGKRSRELAEELLSKDVFIGRYNQLIETKE